MNKLLQKSKSYKTLFNKFENFDVGEWNCSNMWSMSASSVETANIPRQFCRFSLVKCKMFVLVNKSIIILPYLNHVQGFLFGKSL